MRYCKICNKELITEYKYCSDCKKQRKVNIKSRDIKKLIEAGIQPFRYGKSICIYCGKEFTKNSPNQLGHGVCKNTNIHKSVENYNKVKRTRDGKATIGRQTILDLGINIPKTMVVHHLDENPNNNALTNLIIISRSFHSSLHRQLETSWSLLLKDNNSNLENCWKTLRNQITTTYLETKNVKVLKISDIGQSATEPLNENIIYKFSQEEGSETMYQAPKSIAHGEDIVQTQTE